MKLTVALLVAGLGAVLGGCTDYGPIEKELHEVKGQLTEVSTQVGEMKASLDNATEETRQAAQKAAAAESTANQALTMAHSDQTAIERLNEKLDRLEASGRKPTRKAAVQKKAAAPDDKTPQESGPK